MIGARQDVAQTFSFTTFRENSFRENSDIAT